MDLFCIFATIAYSRIIPVAKAQLALNCMLFATPTHLQITSAMKITGAFRWEETTT
jgi:hypothetical protein